MVTENSYLNNEMTTRQLPNHVIGRSHHACSWYMIGESQVRSGWLVMLYI